MRLQDIDSYQFCLINCGLIVIVLENLQNLTTNEIEELIEDKKQKEIEKVVHNWEEEGIKVEKGRWGKFYLIKSKKKILLDKNLDVQAMSVGQAKEIYKANSSNKSKK